MADLGIGTDGVYFCSYCTFYCLMLTDLCWLRWSKLGLGDLENSKTTFSEMFGLLVIRRIHAVNTLLAHLKVAGHFSSIPRKPHNVMFVYGTDHSSFPLGSDNGWPMRWEVVL